MTAPPSTAVDGRTADLRVRIAVLTFRRPQDIAATLPLLTDQAVSVVDEHTEVDIVVVDNDPDGSARPFVTSFTAERGIAVHYENEPTPGISAARNLALASARDRDVLVFIDDDERPTTAWLASLLDTYRKHRSAAVVGPVISQFEGEPDRWVKAGRLFSRPRMPTGTRVELAATNNLLLDLHQVRALGLGFDPRFGLSGGGDTMFTGELQRAGGMMVWSDEAVVIDIVPPNRSTIRWVLSRAVRTGTSWSAVSLALAASRSSRAGLRLRLSGQGLVRMAWGSVRGVYGTLTRSAFHQARGIRIAARGSGMLLGAWGYEYQEYRRRANDRIGRRARRQPRRRSGR
jgi:succinoglycan biosynthesis protein ExoM